MAQRIVDTISPDPMSDRDTIRRGKRITTSDTDIEKGLIFRKFFAEDKDFAILRILKNYFGAVADAFPGLWEAQDNPLALWRSSFTVALSKGCAWPGWPNLSNTALRSPRRIAHPRGFC